MKRNRPIEIEEAPALETFWSGTPEAYDARVEKIQAKAREIGLPVPSRNMVMRIDAFDFENPMREDKVAKLKIPRWWVNEYEETFTEFDRTDRQAQFDLIRVCTNDGETMPDGYLDKVFAQYQAAEEQGI